MTWRLKLEKEMAAFELPLEFKDSGAHRYGAGLWDPGSMQGLRRLRERYPEGWHSIVWELTEFPSLTRDSTARDALLDAAESQAMPRHRRDLTRLKRYRHSLRRLRALPGVWEVSEIDETVLDEIFGRLRDLGYSHETATRDVAMARRAARSLAWATGKRSKVLTKSPPNGCGGRQSPGPAPDVIHRMLQSPYPVVRGAVALAAGGGLTEGWMLWLRGRDFGPRLITVEYRAAIRGEQTIGRGWSVLARWAGAALAEAFSGLGIGAGNALVFPSANNHEEPRRSLNELVRKEAKRLLGDRADGFTLGACRRFWQRTVLASGFPEEATTGTWRMPRRGHSIPPWAGDLAELMGSWEAPTEEPRARFDAARIPVVAPPLPPTPWELEIAAFIRRDVERWRRDRLSPRARRNLEIAETVRRVAAGIPGWSGESLPGLERPGAR